MSDEVQFKDNWEDEATQCKNCGRYQVKDGKHGCVPKDKTFKEAFWSGYSYF
ncbi:hypothetical protein KKH05_00215 [Patescibacteria group bacterium]|nr:hypothetical protein [Patescibacteria group bacterium]